MMPRRAATTRSTETPIDLALQGGGSHGAFTWGALDALLDDETLRFEGVCGASAGAMNAAVFACGYAAGGRDGARRALQDFWGDVGGCSGAFSPGALAGPLGRFNLDDNPLWSAWNAWLQMFSPYQINPGNENPLRDVLAAHVDERALRSGPIKVFVTATSVRTGQARLFKGEELSLDALMASACLPQLFQAVQIDGEPYWDGGFSGNPALWPLIYNTTALDIVLVQLDPLVREGTPRTVPEISDRLNEITFNTGLVAEMRAIAFVKELIAEHRLDRHDYKDLRLHRIADDAALAPLDLSSKSNNDPALLERLFTIGRAAGERFLAAQRGQIGRASSFDIDKVFLAPRR
jgi:NTE family protein